MIEDTSPEPEVHYLERVADFLRDAFVELEVWRQNARTPEERQALHRVTALLSSATGELRTGETVRDPAQQSLQLASAGPASFSRGSGPTLEPAPR